jgi:TRAP transporter 4TM/12TM fusion protein
LSSLLSFNRFRTLEGPMGVFGSALLIAIPLLAIISAFDLYIYVVGGIWREQITGLFLALILAAVFLYSPARQDQMGRVPWFDYALSLVGAVAGLNLGLNYESLLDSAYSPEKMAFGAVTILLVFEAARRLVGMPIVIICAAFLLYAHFAYLFPGEMRGTGIPWQHLFSYVYADAQALIGPPLVIATTVVVAFVLFGEFLKACGAADFINNFAIASTGGVIGGPAKVAVVSSGMMGMVSGSGVSDVMMTGTVTIPMMKKAGYDKNFAGAVEAVASTGGPIMPPVMGAAAFIMADFLAVPYADIVIAAIIPAILYYCGVFFQVDLESRKRKLRAADASDIPPILTVLLRDGWAFLVPFLSLLVALFFLHFEASKGALFAAGCGMAVWALRGRASLGGLLRILRATGESLLTLGVLCAVAGVLMGAVVVSGLGLRLPTMLVAVAAENIWILAALVAVTCVIMGMGLPATAIYVLLATLIAPAMVKLGIDRMGAHLFVFYFGQMSLITPPVALAAFAAATISGGDPMKTGWQASRLGIVAFIVPFAFLFSPTLLMKGDPLMILLDTATAVCGVFLLATASVGYLRGALSLPWRVFVGIAGLLVFIPAAQSGVGADWTANLVGGAMALLFLALRLRRPATDL